MLHVLQLSGTALVLIEDYYMCYNNYDSLFMYIYMDAVKCLEWLRKPYIDPLTSREIDIDGDRYNEIERSCAKYLTVDLLEQTDIQTFTYPESTPLLSFLSLIYFLNLGAFCHPFKSLYRATTRVGDPYIDNFDFSFRWLRDEDGHWKLVPPRNFKKHILSCPKERRFAGIFITIISEQNVTANLLLYDHRDMEWERFVPFGATQDKCNDHDLDLELISYLRSQFPRFQNYYTPYKACPIDSSAISPVLKGMYCAVWNMWFLRLKLSYPDEWREQLIDRAIMMLRQDSTEFNHFVSDYLGFLQQNQQHIISTVQDENLQSLQPHQLDDFLAEYVLSLLRTGST